MSRFSFPCLFFICILVACGPSEEDYVDGIIVFDNAANYPRINMSLSDVVEIEYVPLKGTDKGWFLTHREPGGNDIYIDENEIYIKQPSTGLYVFDRQGNPLRWLNKAGRGPEEYGPFLMQSWVEPETNSIYVSGLQGLYEYDANSLKFRRSGWPKYTFSVPTIAPLNSEYAIVENKYHYNKNIAGGPTPFYLLSLSDWTLEPLPFTVEEPYVHDVDGLMQHSSIIPGQGGVFLCNTRSDTIMWVDRNTVKMTPRMVDKSVYPEQDDVPGGEIMAMPSFETDKYLFFSLVFWPPIYPNLERRAFVFDKREEKIFRLPDTEDWRYFPAQDTRLADSGVEEYWLTTWNTTLNENYGAVMVQSIYLIDNIDNLPEGPKKVARTLKEDDNPVLAIIKLK